MRSVVGILVVLAGCSGREDVVITGIDVHDTPTGIVKRPADLSGLRVQIFAGDERLPAVPVQGDASGQIVVKGVPDGPFVVAVEANNGSRWWWGAESHDVDWTYRHAGRIDARRAEVQQPITLAIDGLASWDPRDSLTAYSLETSTELRPALQPALTNNSTSIAGTFEWNASDAWSSNRSGRPYLMDAGDHFMLARTRSSYTSTATIVRLDQVFEIEAAMQQSGAPVMIAGTMKTPEQTEATRFTVDHPAFASALPVLGTSASWDIWLYQTPAWAGRWALGTPVISLSGGGTIAGEVTSQVEAYPLPFDPAYERWVYGTYRADSFGRAYAISRTRLEDSGYVLGPHTKSASSVLLENQSISSGTVGWDGVSPLELAVPGADDGFVAFIYVLYEEQMRTYSTYVARISSHTGEILLPADVFEVGERYEIQIRIGAEDANGYAYSFLTLGPFSFSPP